MTTSRRSRQRALELLGEPGEILPGSLVVRSLPCGKANCHCKGNPPELHGPYVQWGYGRGRERRTRWLTPEQLQRYGTAIERGRRLKQLISELEDADVRRIEKAEGWGT
jgi:hypothetical protein